MAENTNRGPEMNGNMPPMPPKGAPMNGKPGGKPGEKEMSAEELRNLMKKNNDAPRGPHGRNMIREKPKNAKATVVKLIKYIGKSKYLLLALLGVMILISLLGLAAPALQGKAIDAITAYISAKLLAEKFDREDERAKERASEG